MKRRFTILTAALALLAFLAIPMGMWGQTTASVTFSEQGYTNQQAITTVEFNGVTATFDKGTNSNAPKYYTSGTAIRVYGGNTVTITADDETISAITITFGSSDGSNTITSNVGTYSNGSWTGSATSVTFTVGGSSGNRRFAGLSVTYGSGDTPVETVATPTFSPAAGTYTSAQTVSISCATSGATIYYTTDGSTPTTGSNVYSTALTISETTTVKAMAVKTDMNNSVVATAEYTINLPYTGDDYVRITDVSDLTDGAKVIIAARYNSTATSYYAMTAATIGKPTGVSFTSTTSSNGEVLPSGILDSENTYCWTVSVSGNDYTFTNASNQVLGYTSSTNFATGGDNTEWTISRGTSFGTAMVENYEAFVITNKNITNRAVALNTSHNYGPYDKGNMTNNNAYQYNFYVDIFVQGYVPAAVATPTFNPQAGTYYETQNVTISCDTPNSTIYYTTNGDNPTDASAVYDGPITVSETTSIKAIAYVGTDHSAVATAEYIIELPLSTMDQIFAKATEVGNTATDVRITFNNWVVSGANNSSHTFVTDGTKGFMIYQSNHGFAAGDILSGTVQCRVQLYNGAAEITNLTSSTTGLSVTSGGAVTVANIAMSDLAAINTGALVSYQNLTCSVSTSGNYTNYYLTDGTTQIQAYSTLYSDLANSLEDGKIYNITGVFVQNNSTKRVNPRSAADIVKVEVQHEEYTLTVTPSANVEIYTFVSDDPTEEGHAGEFTAQVYDGTTVGISVSATTGYVLESVVVDNVDVTSQLDETGWYEFTMPAHDVTVTATASLAPVVTSNTYTLATSIESGKQYIIVGKADSKYYAMGYNKGNNRHAVEITSDGATATVTIANTETNAHEFTISSLGGGYYSIMDATTSGGYLYAASSSSNQLKTETTLDENHNGDWNISINAETGVASVVADQSSNRNVMQFNTSGLFNCYSSASQHPVYLYVKDETPTPVTIPLSINAWTTVDGIPGNWYLITSPLKDPIDDPNDVTNMISDTPTNYDLYRFDQAAGFEWINYKDQNFDVNPNFGSLEAGTGYLYANANTVQLQFTGTPYSGTGEFPLAYSESNSDVNMRGWNLVGNPFTVEASVDHTYYRMNENRTDIMVGTGNVAAMEGVFVRASSTNTNQNVKFTRSAKATNSVEQTVIDLSRNNAVIDRAIISFGEDEPLPKIQLNQNNTKIYFMMENGAYAVVIGSYQAELPLNFKAATAGTYTLSFTNQNAEFDVLTLIDNQTNTQVDMLANPSYSFSAQTTDDVERFTVVYERAASYLTIGTGDLYSASGNNSTDSTKDGMGSPVGNTYYTASTAQFIYTASEMEGAKTIKSLAFYHNNQGPFIGTVKIYLDHTSASAVHTGSPATSGTLVYEGTNINIGSTSAGWQTFTLDTPFQYNGTDNLLVVVCRTKATSGNPNYHSDQGWKYTSYSQHYYYMQRSGNSNDTYGNIATTGNYARGFKRPNIKIGYTAPVINHFYLDIDGWTTNRNNYYLIASPIGQVAPTAVDNMLSNTYDLFYFDQDGDEVGYEWITYKPGNGATDPEFNLVPGKGYLYANSGVAGNDPNVVTLTFTGWGYTGSGQVDLIYSEANSDPNMWGWNLVGNPFGVEAYIDRPFYRMNEDGSELKSESETGSIGVMEGVFVHATQNETMTFTTTSNSKGSMVALNLSKDRKVIDRAIVRFGEGKQLPKLQLDKNSTKLYISQDNKDYALVSAEEQGEMPVSFKAEDNGTYNLNFSSENVEFAYLHLIDNMTGTDVDLLQTPSYSFEAKTTDYESRFKLVFATGDNSKEDNFAFFSNGSFVINNEGNATLQVIDVTGRIIKCESINGCANVNMNAAPGVYMLRLINGDNVKVQKVVVR